MDRRIVAAVAAGLLVLGLVAAALLAGGTAEPTAPPPPGRSARRQPVVREVAPVPDPEPEPAVPAPRAAPDPGPAGGDAKSPGPPEPTPDGPDAADLAEDPADGELFLHPVDKDGIQDAVTEALPEIRECYRTLLESYPDVAGAMTLAFEISNQGDRAIVTGVEVVDSTVDSVYMEGCVVTAMEDLPFEPLSQGGTLTVRYPFRFDQAE
ncbi:MAG: AgmX/PglI C-terminal domain-containing protein [Myxococcota bacterium]